MKNSTVCFALMLSALMLDSCGTGEASARFPQGQEMYELFCANCHMKDGTGLKDVIPPLAGADFLKARQDELPCLIRNGASAPMLVNGKTYEGEMPPNDLLTEFEITNIINYINSAWGNGLPVVKHEAVREKLRACE